MRYLPMLLVTFLAGCPVPPKTPQTETAPAAPMAAPVAAPAAWPVELPEVEVVAPRVKVVKPVKADGKNPCAGINADDINDSINLKLECIERELK
ncbi:MAG TPA: hypothetical protein VHO48_13900 [Anaerolineaceae bacterium]|nr:hypothetical protein [Anaerolineaceae bacterium]